MIDVYGHFCAPEATRLALLSLPTNQNTTRQVTIFYVTTGSFSNVTSPIANVTSLLANIEDAVYPGTLTVYGIGVDNYTQSGLEELVRAGNNTCRVKSLNEWKHYLYPSNTSKDSTGNGTDMLTSGSSNSTFSSLMAFFIIFNLTFVIVVIALCIWAGKSRPELKINLKRSSINGTKPLATIRANSRPLPAVPSEETSLQTNGLNQVILDNVDDLTNRPLPGPSSAELTSSSGGGSRDDLPCTPQTSPPPSKFNTKIPQGDKPVDDISRWLPSAPPKEPASLPQSSPRANLREKDLEGWTTNTSQDSPDPSRGFPRIPRGDQPVDDISRWLPSAPPKEPASLPQSSPRANLRERDLEGWTTNTSQDSPDPSRVFPRIPRGVQPVDEISRWLPPAHPKKSASLPQSSRSANLKEMDFPESITASPPESPASSRFSPRIPRADQPIDDINRWLPPLRPSKIELPPLRIRDSDEPFYVNVKSRNTSYFDVVRKDARKNLDKVKRISRRIISVFAE
ncbi:hypothetical protein LSH36_136g00041 [Paralvinella palmiformis]|uniref:Uncharacterized protein n=1 Tax=Paralvinella palmiformis TaxID=53620 RepID=A0AAD9N7S6_9ANNE|nr:hypothetical protein LSH36_136g00041 [Paralvinella palmiformis]